MKNSEIARIDNVRSKPDAFYLEWKVTSACNYQCAFCIQGDAGQKHILAKGESVETRAAVCKKIVSFIEDLRGFKAVEVHLIGGEVSILKDFPELLNSLSGASFDGDMTFHMTTNISQPAEYYCRLFDIVRKQDNENRRRSLTVASSFYSSYISIGEYVSKLRTIKHYLRRKRVPLYIKAFFREGIHLKKNLPKQTSSLSAGIPIITDEDYDLFWKTKKELHRSGITARPVLIRQFETTVSRDKTDKLIREFNNGGVLVTDVYGNELRFENIQALGMEIDGADRFCPRGYRCNAGEHSIWINSFGEVFRCPAIGSMMKIGSILDDSFGVLKEPKICNSDHCSCNTFGVIWK